MRSPTVQFSGRWMPLMLLGTLVVGCASPNRYIARHGTPDMIYEEAGDRGRYYRGNDRAEPWRSHLTRLFYLREQRQVTFERGACTVEALEGEALTTAAERLRRLSN
jgi:hypothetical protein